MRFLIFLCLLFSISAKAADFIYVETPAFDSPSPFELAVLAQKINQSGFFPLEQSGNGRIAFLGVDQVFAKNEETIFLKLGMKVSDEKLYGKILPHKKGFLFHAKTESKTPYALFFYEMTFDQVRDVLEKSGQVQISKPLRNDSFSKFEIFYRLTNLEARAASPVACKSQLAIVRNANEMVIAGAFAVGDVLKSCAVSALKGVQDGVQNSWETIKKVFQNPAQLWDDVVKTYEQIKDLVLNLGTRLTEFFNTMKNTDPAILAEIACSTMANVIVSSMIGGGLAKAGLMIGAKIAALSKAGIKSALAAMSRIQKLNPNSPHMKNLARDVVACAK